MIRVSEMVLPGHPDKVCDIVADAVVAEAYRLDPHAGVQVEAGIYGDSLWLSGHVAASVAIRRQVAEIARDALRSIGLKGGNTVAAEDFAIECHVGVARGDPRPWTGRVNDQSIVAGWAGYDPKTRFLPPEHFLAHAFREALAGSCRRGALRGEGPDGKLLVRVREEGDRWTLEHAVATLQHRRATPFVELCGTAAAVLGAAYRRLRAADSRWAAPWEDVELLVNPNGPLVDAGSRADNGQTGRKLVMDFYGPRVPLGGGALSGKDLWHVDRAGAYAARQAAVTAVAGGARECRVTAVWAPNGSEPLEVIYEMEGRGPRLPDSWFRHDTAVERLLTQGFDGRLAEGTHFWDPGYGWNRAAGT